MQDWAEIRRLHKAESMPIKAIARTLSVARNTVRATRASDEPSAYRRARKGSLVDAVEPEARQLLAVDAKMAATVIAERIGWEHSITILKDQIRRIRPDYAGFDPADRIVHQPGRSDYCTHAVQPRNRGIGSTASGGVECVRGRKPPRSTAPS